MASINKKPFSKSMRMEDGYQVVNSLGLRQLFAQNEIICIAGDTSRHCITWFPIDKSTFFLLTERRSDIYRYQYVVESTIADTYSCVRIHAVERSRKNETDE